MIEVWAEFDPDANRWLVMFKQPSGDVQRYSAHETREEAQTVADELLVRLIAE